MSAAEAARDLIRPGRPWPHYFPLGEDPVAATRAHGAVCHDAALLRLCDAEVQLLNGDLPSSKTRNSPLVNAVVTAVLNEHFNGALDFDFDADDVQSLQEAAINFRNTGISNAELRERMLDLTAVLREMMQHDLAEDN